MQIAIYPNNYKREEKIRMGLIKKYCGKINKNEFVKNVLILFSGAVVAQFLPILFTPVLSRMYNPAAFGIFSVFVGITNITSQIACLRYDYALVVAEDDDEATKLFLLSSVITFMFSVITAVIFIPFSSQLSVLFSIKETPQALLLVPLTTFIISMTSVLNYYNVRFKNYKIITSANIIKSIFAVIIQIVLGLLHFGYWGLLLGQLISYGFGNTRMLMALKGKIHKEMLDIKILLLVAGKYQNYAKFTVASSVANNLTYNLLPSLITGAYSQNHAGYYGMINRTLGLPLTLISNTVSQVFMKQVSDEKTDGEKLATTFKKVSKMLMLISVIPFALLFIFAEPVIPFVLGNEWAPAAKFLKYLIPLFAVRFVVGPISSSALVMQKQKATMFWQFGLFLCAMIPSAIKLYFNIPFETYLIILSILLSVGYLIFYRYCYNMIRKSK